MPRALTAVVGLEQGAVPVPVLDLDALVGEAEHLALADEADVVLLEQGHEHGARGGGGVLRKGVHGEHVHDGDVVTLHGELQGALGAAQTAAADDDLVADIDALVVHVKDVPGLLDALDGRDDEGGAGWR